MSQINTHLGNTEKNIRKIVAEVTKASQNMQADLIIFPELTLLGYAPYDLLERPEIINDQKKSLKKLIKLLPKRIGVLVGGVTSIEKKIFNSAFFIHNGKVVKTFSKALLPEYDVFYDARHFTAGDLKNNYIKFKGVNLFVSICEDIWGYEQKNQYTTNPIENLKKEKKIDYFINLSASPYTKKKHNKRISIAKSLVQRFSCSFIYVNQVGAQDELIFDGQSFYIDHKNHKTHIFPKFKEQTSLVERIKKVEKTSKYEDLYNALSLGIKDYFLKTGFKKAVLGLSGGLDSALVACLLKESLGAENVCAIAMPGPHSSKLSFDLAKQLSKNLRVEFYNHPINSAYNKFLNEYDQTFPLKEFGLVHENLQARLRGLTLMTYSNQKNALLMATSNKSELCVGYSTLYGDQCGALLPIGDLLKTEVYELCQWINENKSKPIPEKIITRPPSAELRPNQKDSDSLPEYSQLDEAISNVIVSSKAPKNELERWVLKRSQISEFKRWQAAPVLKVSEKSFGRGRMMPLAQNFKLK